jgi:hypothetical protein
MTTPAEEKSQVTAVTVEQGKKEHGIPVTSVRPALRSTTREPLVMTRQIKKEMRRMLRSGEIQPSENPDDPWTPEEKRRRKEAAQIEEKKGES